MLKQVLVGPSGLRSSELVLGAMAFGDTRPWGCPAVEAEAIMGIFVEAGGTTVDTAPNYADGRSEAIVGAFAQGRRDELVISTKYTAASSTHPLAGGNSRRSMVQSVEGSLRRLKTDRIDILWLHFWDHTTPLDEIIRAADDLVSAGKILYFGILDTPAWLISRAATLAQLQGRAPVIAVQLEFNVVARGAERDLLPMCESLNLAAFCWGPLAAGALAGGDAPIRQPVDRLAQPLREARAAIIELAEQTGLTASGLALRWLMQSGPARIPIVGARAAEQFRQVVRSVADPIDDETFAKVNAMGQAGTLFPEPLLSSPYLRKFAMGTPDRFVPLASPRC